MFSADGTTISMNPAMDAARAFVDYNNDGHQNLWGVPSPGLDYVAGVNIPMALFNGGYFEQRLEDEEPYVAIAPFLCVFDDDHVREIYDTNTWTSFNTRTADYTAYLTQNADRLHFSRYTGVVMK
jgi:hypothetical protein